MAEEVKNIRLNKAAKEFNVGIQSLVDFLAKKGHQVDLNPNTRITAEQYSLLTQAFQAEREVKEQADKIAITPSSNSVVIEANSQMEEANNNDSYEEVIIKNVFTQPAVSKPSTRKSKEKTAEEDSTKIVETTEQPKTETTEVPTPEPAPESKTPQETEPTPEPEHTPAIEPAETDTTPEPQSDTPGEKPTEGANSPAKSTNVGELHIIDKIDLSAINNKTRPDKKSKNQTKKQQPQHTPAAAKEVKPVAEKATPQAEPKATPASAPEPEFIQTEYTKLEGPKIVNKIDLSQFEKGKSDNGERKKRKHIKKEGVRVDENGNGQNNKSANQSNNKNEAKKAKNNKNEAKKAKPAIKKPEIDDTEIEKQIRDTLARLGNMGKSKTSKHNREKRQKVHQRIEEEQLNEMESQKTLQVTEFVTANELATMMNIPVTQIISTCMSVGIFVSINQRLDAETIKLIADEFGFDINFASADVVDTIHKIEEEDNPDDLVPRNPIITVMGHVDHGKTSLLDYIRKTNVIAGEAGGITQHIGAYEVTTADGRKITFLDTPGHEAFTAMRARGAKVTDIAIIVIAADDRIMPQTIEAINHAQAAGVPIVFAINKIDKPSADPDRIKTELANMNLLVEEWGGKYQSQDISAKKGLNVEELLEKVILQADIMELKGNPKKRAKGTVLESSLDKGRGYVAKILVEDGSIHKGDPIVAGAVSGRVRAMYNERNQEVLTAGPSQPVLLLGLNGACQAGDTFNIMENEKEAKEIAAKRTQLQREQGIRTQTHVTLDEIGRRIALGNFKELNIIVKGDVDGSVEALSDSLIKLGNEEVQVNVIHKAVGQITESDVLLAESSDAIIIGFQVRPSVGARKMAETQQIDIRLYSIIYDAINELKDAIEGMLAPETQEKIVANLEIRETFKISKVGTIAGCMCLDGKITRQHSVRIIRDGIVVFTGKLASLKRFKDDVKEVVSGQDCGLNIENFNDIKVGDIVEAYEVIEIKRKL